MAILIIAIGTSIIFAMSNIWFDIEDKVSRELKVYGSNIMIKPKSQTLPSNTSDLGYDLLEEESFIDESDLKNLKTVFWRNNIIGFAPYLEEKVYLKSNNKKQHFTLVGTWFNKKLEIATGETFYTGIKKIKPWWSVDGKWASDNYKGECCLPEVMVGSSLAGKLNVKKGSKINLFFDNNKKIIAKVAGIFSSDENEENRLFAPIALVQYVRNLNGKASFAEVSALTTPDNELAKKYEKDPKLLSSREFEVWYCTAFVKSISYQIEEVIKGSEAKPIRQISDSEGIILNKIKYLMLVLMVMAFMVSTIGIWNLMSGYVMERRTEVGLSKAIGASDMSIALLFSSEAILLGLIGAVVGIGLGSFFSSVIGLQVFNHTIKINTSAILISISISAIIAFLGNISVILAIIKLNTKEVLHAR